MSSVDETAPAVPEVDTTPEGQESEVDSAPPVLQAEQEGVGLEEEDDDDSVSEDDIPEEDGEDDDDLRPEVAEALELIGEEVQNKYLGGDLVIPEKLEGASVLDLGSGSGLQSYVLSRLVGENGRVTGIESSEELLQVAKNNADSQAEAFGYKSSNVSFVQGTIEKLTEAGLAENTFDVIVSNGAINQASDKSAVLSAALSVLKEGGEFYFSDIYANQAISEDLRNDKSLWSEGFGGALVWEDLYNIAEKVGFSTPRLVNARPYDAKNDEQRNQLGDTQFVLATYRLFKLPETRQSAALATFDGKEDFVLDRNFVFKAGESVNVNDEVATILQSSRFASSFTFETPSKKPHSEGEVARENPFVFA